MKRSFIVGIILQVSTLALPGKLIAQEEDAYFEFAQAENKKPQPHDLYKDVTADETSYDISDDAIDFEISLKTPLPAKAGPFKYWFQYDYPGEDYLWLQRFNYNRGGEYRYWQVYSGAPRFDRYVQCEVIDSINISCHYALKASEKAKIDEMAIYLYKHPLMKK